MDSELPARAGSEDGTAGTLGVGAVAGGRFRIDELLRREDVTALYRATDLNGGAPAAVRVVALSMIGPAATQLQADLATAASIPQKNLAAVYDQGVQGDEAWVATELIDGQSLREVIDAKRADGRTMTLKGAYNLIAHVSNALGEAHKRIVHGGLSPACIWVNRAGRVKVTDLGLVRAMPGLARRGAPAGAADSAYMAPEVATGAPASVGGDVYSLGAILFELLTGRAPLPPLRKPSELNRAVPEAVDAIIGKALTANAAHRWRTPGQMKQALSEVVAATVEEIAPDPSTSGDAMAVEDAALARPSIGRAFAVADFAGGAADDGVEHWLVRRERLDYGPFSMAQIRAQIERGEIRGEHLIIDVDTGAAKRIRDFAPLKEFTKQAERRLEAARRAQADQKQEKVEIKQSRTTAVVVVLALLGLGAGVGLYLVTRPTAKDEALASRVGSGDVDEFLKKVKFDFSSVQVHRRAAGGGAHRGGAGARPGSGGGADEFNNDMNLGDVSSGVGDETLDESVIQRVMTANYRALVPCIMQERSRSSGLSNISLEFVIRGTGKVSAVKVNGQRGGPFPACVLGKMQGFGFPKFNGAKTIAGWSMRMS